MPHKKTLTVYLGSSGHTKPVFRETAEKMGRIIGEGGTNLVYGGMDAGLMGIVASASLAAGANVTGIIPRRLKDSERMLEGITETIIVDDLWDRKKRMFALADAVVTLPGGFGTLDETSEVLFWGKLGLHNKPLVLVNTENYWDDLIGFLKPLPDYDERFLIVVDGVDDVISALESWSPPPSVDEPDHYPHFEDEIIRDTNEPIIMDKPSVENTYYVICALGLKQLGRHSRPIGFLNTNGQFDGLLAWINRAAEETFITKKCLGLFSVADNADDLRSALKEQSPVAIDLHNLKWGPRKKD
ncbi:MAG: hypothetical protein DHS20C02_09190 [Micavibrio sp.]|nr:MAG: hypothetical protein DHS20C02_09190 [Micavibrio sp.]